MAKNSVPPRHPHKLDPGEQEHAVQLNPALWVTDGGNCRRMAFEGRGVLARIRWYQSGAPLDEK